MDMPNDPHNTRNISKFFDSPDTHADPFGVSRSYDRAYRRAERIVAAVFLATKHLPNSEPLSVSARIAATKILELLISFQGASVDNDSAYSISIRASVRYLISLLRMLTVSGFVSMKNTGVLTGALDELCSFLESAQHSSFSEATSFSRDDFRDVDRDTVMDIKDKRTLKDSTRERHGSHVSNISATGREPNVRSQNILGILRSGREFGIADIASNLPEYSKKMIQRELADLVVAGKVKREGLKRWSRYSIVS